MFFYAVFLKVIKTQDGVVINETPPPPKDF